MQLIKDQNDVLKAELDINALIKLPENLKNIGNFLTALSIPVPDNVKAMGNGMKSILKTRYLAAKQLTKTTLSLHDTL